MHIFEKNYENIHPAERGALMAGEDWEQDIEGKILNSSVFILVFLVNSSQTIETPGSWLLGHLCSTSCCP